MASSAMLPCAGPQPAGDIVGRPARSLATMGTYALDSVFAPASLALVGASPRERSLGRLVLRQVIDGGFRGRIGVVNRKYPEIEGVATAPRLGDLGFAPELVIIATPPEVVARAAASAADAGARAVIVLTRGMGEGPGSHNAALAATARARGLRVVGPNCLGVIAPHANLHASFAAHRPPPGDLALISQSGAVGAAMIEWAHARGLGFSAVVSLGDAVDVDFADLLDWFATDRHTRAILLYL